MLYLGRVTPLKGLPMLIRALARIRSQLDNGFWSLRVPKSLIMRQRWSRSAQGTEDAAMGSIVGPLYGQQKRDAFAAASLFVLPSYSEAFSLVVVEALGAGVPVLTTKGVPWPNLRRITADGGLKQPKIASLMR